MAWVVDVGEEFAILEDGLLGGFGATVTYLYYPIYVACCVLIGYGTEGRTS